MEYFTYLQDLSFQSFYSDTSLSFLRERNSIEIQTEKWGGKRELSLHNEIFGRARFRETKQ